jgi:hypothetical protein
MGCLIFSYYSEKENKIDLSDSMVANFGFGLHGQMV